MVSPLGQVTRYAYNALDQITSITDALGGVTSFSYDGNGNLLSVTDPEHSQNPTTYTYDNMDRLETRTDPLGTGHSETYAYGKNGNLTTFTDRDGNVTTYQSDALNRLSFVGFGTQAGPTYASTITYTYDAGNRLTQAVDSIAGTFTRSYDGLDRLTGEQGPEGTVSYAYDADGRRTQMTVSGQSSPVTYAYDNDNRLTGITQGTAGVSFSYDAAGRRTALTLPDGIVVNYGYDQASELTGLSYSQGGNVLGDLAYAYDADGRRTQMSGTWARTGMPNPTTSTAVYNVDNELTNWNGATLTYDLSGNLVNDSANTYTWSARNQLASISGTTAASFVYGPFGRRQQKTINGATTDFLYDGVNPVQELSGTTVTANLLTGLGLDEYFTRTDSTGTADFLSDALGSTIALADSSGTVQTAYTYAPFGGTTTQGTGSANSLQFTGRENDGDGLYYYRARYYSSKFDRFDGQDPVGFDGGIDLYAYAEGSPSQMKDPFGLFPPGWTGLCKNSRCAKLFERVFHLTPQQFNADAGNIPWYYSPSADTFGPLSWNFLSGNGNQTSISDSFAPGSGTEAATASGGSPSSPAPVVLGPDWFYDTGAHAAAVLLHEATHSITGWTDKQIFDTFSKYGLPNQEFQAGEGTDAFTQWLMKGCPM